MIRNERPPIRMRVVSAEGHVMRLYRDNTGWHCELSGGLWSDIAALVAQLEQLPPKKTRKGTRRAVAKLVRTMLRDADVELEEPPDEVLESETYLAFQRLET